MDEKQIRELAEVSARAKSNTHQIEEIKKDIKEMRTEQKTLYDLTTSVKLIAQDMSYVKGSVDDVKQGQCEMNKKIQEIESSPAKMNAKKWEGIKAKVLYGIIALLIASLGGAVLTLIGL